MDKTDSKKKKIQITLTKFWYDNFILFTIKYDI